MKTKTLLTYGLTLAVSAALSVSEPVMAKTPQPAETSQEALASVSPRYNYIISTSLAVHPESSKVGYNLKVFCISDITSISGTLTLYKKNSEGNYEKKASKSVSCSGNNLNTESSFSSYGSGTYKLTFAGKVSGSNISESFTISAEK